MRARFLVAVGAPGVGGGADEEPGINAVHVFSRNAGTWQQEALVKASNARKSALFGFDVALAGDMLVVGSPTETSSGTGVGATQADAVAEYGAAYVLTRSAGVWSQRAYVKPSTAHAGAYFGSSVAISDGALAVGVHFDRSKATGINGDAMDTSAELAGAVYAY